MENKILHIFFHRQTLKKKEKIINDLEVEELLRKVKQLKMENKVECKREK